ncbi:hypothetical protein F2Q69_00054148 [Brassica cretica]|uniref:Mannosyl-oligosaccharide glucosidase n=1 Tax=Brassica cretica TaxID=69181 RepID=A0A8S9MZ80_BRACR|nr:hypothetical protein F2Q69_00054148 [Brassica cretica]
MVLKVHLLDFSFSDHSQTRKLLCTLFISFIYSDPQMMMTGASHEIAPDEFHQIPRVITPFPAPKLSHLPMFQGDHKESLYWGTYRPQVYFGVRARTPQSLVAGLMWLGDEKDDDGKHMMRHFCENSQDLKSFGWREHNGVDFGRQELLDQDMILETSFVKSKEGSLGYGGDWSVRINLINKGLNDEVKRTVHLFFYLTDEGGTVLNLGKNVLDLKESSVLASGSRADVGNWQMHLKSEAHIDAHYCGFKTPDIVNLSDAVQKNLAVQLDSETLMVGKAAIGNMLGGIGYFYGQSKIKAPKSTQLQAKSEDEFLLYWPGELYTAVPSRPVFPRGFLWDEGFHQLLVWRWDFRITLEILGNWLDLMNIDGWIPREQILGDEALSKIPKQYVVQIPSNGNPPTLLLVIRDLINGIRAEKFNKEERDEILSFLDLAFVRLDAWFQWFNTSQKGKEMGSYYWHGRDSLTNRELNPQSLSSGFDDYPRASHPTEDERHVDLRCWMHLAADCMNSIIEFLGGKGRPVTVDYSSTVKLLSDFNLLNQMHYDHDLGAYLDFGDHTEDVRLVWKEVTGEDGRVSRELVREAFGKPELRLVPHIGYVSFFPFMFRIIPPASSILEKQLDLISNKSIVWSDYGLLSLGKTSSLYMKYNTEHEAPYWRGAIWMNMNYMILSSLHHYSIVDGPYMDKARTIYEELRSNLIRNVVRNYDQTGYIWEHYDQTKGTGEGGRVFTGWSALILLIMSEEYPLF